MVKIKQNRKFYTFDLYKGWENAFKQLVHKPNAIESPTDSNFEAFGGGGGGQGFGYRGLVATTWLSMGAWDSTMPLILIVCGEAFPVAGTQWSQLTPHLGTLLFGGLRFGVGGGGVKNSLRIGALVCVCGPGSSRSFSFIYAPPNPSRGSRVPTPGTPSCPPAPIWLPTSDDLAVVTLDRLFSGT